MLLVSVTTLTALCWCNSHLRSRHLWPRQRRCSCWAAILPSSFWSYWIQESTCPGRCLPCICWWLPQGRYRRRPDYVSGHSMVPHLIRYSSRALLLIALFKNTIGLRLCVKLDPRAPRPRLCWAATRKLAWPSTMLQMRLAETCRMWAPPSLSVTHTRIKLCPTLKQARYILFATREMIFVTKAQLSCLSTWLTPLMLPVLPHLLPRNFRSGPSWCCSVTCNYIHGQICAICWIFVILLL